MRKEPLLCVNISVVKKSHKKLKKLLALFQVRATAAQNLDDTFFSLEDILRLFKTYSAIKWVVLILGVLVRMYFVTFTNKIIKNRDR